MRRNNFYDNVDQYGDPLDPVEMDAEEIPEEDMSEETLPLPPDIEADVTEHSLLRGYLASLKESDPAEIPANLKICLDLEGYVWTILSTRFRTYFRYYDDLYAEAMLAILQAFPRYNPDKGAKTTFFQPYILHAVCGWLNQFVMFSTSYYQTVETQINNTLREHDSEDLDEDAIIRFTGLSKCTVRKVMCMKQMRKLSQCRELSDAHFLSMAYDEMYPKFVSPEQFVQRAEEGSLLIQKLSVLDEKERKLVSDYYGLDGKAPMKVTALARKYGSTSYKIMQALNQSMEKMKMCSKSKKFDNAKKGRM